MAKKYLITWKAEVTAETGGGAVLMAFQSLLFDPRAGYFRVEDPDGNFETIGIEDIQPLDGDRTDDDTLH